MLSNDYSLRERNTFGFDSKAQYFFEYQNVEELEAFLKSGFLNGKKHFHMGGGSNLVLPSHYDGVMLHSAIKGIECIEEDEERVILRVAAGEIWDEVVDYCVEHGYYGAENLSLIPGEVGASAVQNIGAYGCEVKELIQKVETIRVSDVTKREFSVGECQFGYRSSIFKKDLKDEYIVTYVHYRLEKKPHFNLAYQSIQAEVEKLGKITLKNVRIAIINTRKGKLPDPKEIGSAGSFFMNPVVGTEFAEALQKEYPTMPTYKAEGGTKLSAGWLIEQCGWKGKTLGHVGVYEKQALVLVNRGGGTGEEIQALAKRIIVDVKSKFDVELHAEANFV